MGDQSFEAGFRVVVAFTTLGSIVGALIGVILAGPVAGTVALWYTLRRR